MDGVVVLPRYVLSNDNTILVANEERELEVREVQVARAEPRFVYLTGGVEDGEMVVTTTLDAPIPGTRLVISGEQAPAAATAAATDGAADPAGGGS